MKLEWKHSPDIAKDAKHAVEAEFVRRAMETGCPVEEDPQANTQIPKKG